MPRTRNRWMLDVAEEFDGWIIREQARLSVEHGRRISVREITRTLAAHMVSTDFHITLPRDE